MNDQSSPDSKLLYSNVDATANVESETRLRYAAIRHGVPDGLPITVLHIGAEETAIATGTGAETEAILVLSIGSRKTADECFKQYPPTPGEMENAIVVVEDAVALAGTMIVNGSTLFTIDSAIHDIAVIAGVPDTLDLILNRDVVERTFGRLAGVTLGRSAAGEGVPPEPRFAATLLILREFMQHLQFFSIIVKG